jgi:hypothetical protein
LVVNTLKEEQRFGFGEWSQLDGLHRQLGTCATRNEDGSQVAQLLFEVSQVDFEA